MRHRVKKIKFKKGKDANKMLVKKLLLNFIKKGKIKTTIKKGKVLRTVVDRLINLAKENKKNLILKYINNKKITEFLINKVVPVFSERKTGFTSIKKIGKRLSDGSEMVILSWVKPVVISNKDKNEKKQTQTDKTNKSTKKE